MRAEVGADDGGALLVRELRTLVDRLRGFSDSRYAARGEPPLDTKADVAFHLAERLAALAQRAEGVEPPHQVPRLADHVLADQLAAVGVDLVAASPDRDTAAEALLEIAFHREQLDGSAPLADVCALTLTVLEPERADGGPAALRALARRRCPAYHSVGPAAHPPWLPGDFVHPERVDVGDGHHLRPIRESDVELDMVAVMGSRERLWSIFGDAWGWPPAGMTREQDREDLARHADETARHESFNYALFDDAETALLGCVYIDPPEKRGADAEISWWVVDALVGSAVEAALDRLVPRWVSADWPFRQPRFIGRDLRWQDWLALPDC